MKSQTLFEQAHDDNKIDHALLQFLLPRKCAGVCQPIIIKRPGQITERAWECDVCGAIIAEYKLIEISDDFERDKETDNVYESWDDAWLDEQDYPSVPQFYDGQ